MLKLIRWSSNMCPTKLFIMKSARTRYTTHVHGRTYPRSEPIPFQSLQQCRCRLQNTRPDCCKQPSHACTMVLLASPWPSPFSHFAVSLSSGTGTTLVVKQLLKMGRHQSKSTSCTHNWGAWDWSGSVILNWAGWLNIVHRDSDEPRLEELDEVMFSKFILILWLSRLQVLVCKSCVAASFRMLPCTLSHTPLFRCGVWGGGGGQHTNMYMIARAKLNSPPLYPFSIYIYWKYILEIYLLKANLCRSVCDIGCTKIAMSARTFMFEKLKQTANMPSLVAIINCLKHQA